MCGICGIVRSNNPSSIDPALLQSMCETLHHRGPDDLGIYVSPERPGAEKAGLGHARLSIIDLETGHQPIPNEDRTIWVICNGEIYNFRALRKGLESAGHRFSTRSDTEVLVHLYEEKGLDSPILLNGMFAYALWDEARQRLLLVRDLVGIKPLYYRELPGGLAFGSEIKPLLKVASTPTVDLQALSDFLSLNYIPGPASIFHGIRKLMPGHFLVWEKGGFRIERYWDLQKREESIGLRRTEASVIDELLELLRDSVSGQLVSDVPLGVFLSGGLDSSAVTAMAARVSGTPIRTFSIGFSEKSYSELKQARKIARRYGTEHFELMVKPDAEDVVFKLPLYFDEPFADSSAVPVYFLSKMARQHVKVALGGDGGDEIFAGYPVYAAWRLARLYRRLPAPLRRGLIPSLVRRLPVSHAKINLQYRAGRFVQGAELPPDRAHFFWKQVFSEEAKQALWSGASAGNRLEPLEGRRIFERHYHRSPYEDELSRLQYVDLNAYLPDDILTKVDRMSMAHSLEVRVPLLDHRVVEFLASVPPDLKLKGLTKKYLLRRAMAGILPWSAVHGVKKGFNAPVASWINGDLRKTIDDVLSPKRIKEQGFFRPEVVAGLLQQHRERKANLSHPIWGLFCFGLWCDRYLK